ncbi:MULTISPECIES: hypothetical protein [unclassified Bradyrhizobium]|uniref:hypothetical protein n=1 Tax=unclassified Bradyrhizobium TaxID=2631580 RepID=UPI0029162D3B|nr:MULTISPECIES: hypothetical protein [unclassified Bradyrhizobium]
MKALKAVSAVVPSLALVFVGKWLELFSTTRLTHPEWQLWVDDIALGAGAFVAMFLCIGMEGAPKKRMRFWSWIGFALTLLLLAGCWLVRLYLGPPRPGEIAPDPIFWQDVWQTLYILAMILLIATLTLAALTLKRDKPVWFWVSVVVGALILVLGIVGFIWWLVQSNSRIG